MKTISQEDYDKLINFVYEEPFFSAGGSHFSGMTYEQGMMAVLDVLEGNQTADEAVET